MMRIVCLALVLVLGCNSPTVPDMDCATQHGCAQGPASPLPRNVEQYELDQAREEVSAILSRQITTPDPQVRYVKCPFQVKNSNFGNVCAAGVTEWKSGYIQVMTFDPNRTAPLVRWEAKNYFLCTNGACDKAI